MLYDPAVSSPDEVDKSPDYAHSVNVDAACRLASISAHIGARYIHISTDMVFDGSKSPYRSTDMPNPLSIYGRSKTLGEEEVMKYPKGIAFRFATAFGVSPRLRLDLLVNDLSYSAYNLYW